MNCDVKCYFIVLSRAGHLDIFWENKMSLESMTSASKGEPEHEKYAAALERKCGRERIRIFGFAFRGKEVLIEGGYLGAYEGDG